MGTRRAAERVLASTTVFVERRLKLRVNRDKSAADRSDRRGLLGFGFFKRAGQVKVRVDRRALKAVRARIRRLTARNWGVSMHRRIAALNRFISGWCAYFAWAETPSVFAELDEWLRRRLRQCAWKQWKRIRTRIDRLRSLGIPRRSAFQWANSRKGSWRIAGSAVLQRALPNAHWRDLGLVDSTEAYNRVRAVW